jgi:UDP-N-acetylmuramyl pentapeptide phosphotransferase/UDP-N-acetylglucosamine-1-phosphate transferase
VFLYSQQINKSFLYLFNNALTQKALFLTLFFILESFYITAIITFLFSLILAIILVPKVRYIVKFRELNDHPGVRSSHLDSTPTMGGVAFFLIILFVSSIINPWDSQMIGVNLLSALGLMFAVGIKDDLMVSTPRAKIGAEVLAIFFILFCNCLHVNSFQGFLGIENIPVFASYAFIILMLLTIINSYNMVDGIDGLASSIGIVIFSVYGFIFFILELQYYFLLCLSLTGILLGYLQFNLSKKDKIFMGDTGSLIIGFCIGFLSLRFLSTDIDTLQQNYFNPENTLILIGAIFFIPLFDTLRIIGVRLLNKKSPFGSDHNHIHHILIKLGLSHLKASLLLSFINLLIAAIFISISSYFNSYEMMGLMVFCFCVFSGIFYLLKIKIKTETKKETKIAKKEKIHKSA